MSHYDDYDDGPKRYHTTRTRQRDRDDPDYMREEIYVERGKGAGPPPRDLVFRGREDSIEDIERDFPPPNGRDYRRSSDYGRPRRARSARGRYDDYDDYDDRYTEAGAAGGAAAGYAAGRRASSRRGDRRDRGYGSDYSDESPRRDRDRRKSGVGEMLEGLGLGGVAGALLGKKDQKDRDDRSVRSRSRPGTSRAGRSYRSEGERSRSRSQGRKTERQWAQAAQAAVIAGAIEAFRSRKEAGPWTGDKGKRIATAAISAGGIDRLLDKNPDEKKKRHLAEAVIGGLVANRVANGPTRSKSRGPDGRGRSPDSFVSGRSGRSGKSFRERSRSVIDRFRGRSQSRGPNGEEGEKKSGLQGLVAGGALATAGAALYNQMRNKSRNRQRSRSSSADSYVPSRNRRRDMRRDRRSYNPDTAAGAAVTTRQMRGIDRGREDRDTNSRNGNNDRAIAVGGGAGAAALAARDKNQNENQNGEHDRNPDHISESSSTTSMENKRKKMRGKELITAGLATVATIHAVHGVYSSMQAHEKRHRLVAEGEMSKEEAKKRQTKAWVQDAAAVGIAALGIKGAFSEWKEMNEQRHEIHEIEKRKRERRKKREKRRKEEDEQHRTKMLEMMEKNPQAAMMMMHQDNINKGGYPMPVYMPQNGSAGGQYGGVEQSGNPYAPSGGRRGY